ncbi:MBL fold metallo-hydrolase [Risungbinella massiliensis]|uniref:MBL fold metallo-hydrolase n=1 Tax=Risungbinella massiliensis TaxID=1329796 RepID=UPI0005CC8545|nr:MBL fold metallo-hydrolase [Risungbinella massiliensis]
MKQVKWHLFQGGYCTHPGKIVNPKSNWKKRVFPALFFLIVHPEQGPILIDTGYSKYFFKETKRFPFSLFHLLTPVTFEQEEEAVQQIKKVGISPEDVKWIVLTHLHADHIAGVKDFPNATFICSQKELNAVHGKGDWKSLRRGFIPNLLPSDFGQRVKVIEELSQQNISAKFSMFNTAYDLFGDNSLIAVDLPGHAQGQIGLFFQDEQGKTIFLASDSCWVKEAYEEIVLPHPLSNLITEQPKEYRESLVKVHNLAKEHPDIRIIPSHCLDTWEEYKKMGR